MSWTACADAALLIRNGTPPLTVFASPSLLEGTARTSAATRMKLVTPATAREEMIARGTRRDDCTTSSATSPADSKP
jgi:hypothetical protein